MNPRPLEMPGDNRADTLPAFDETVPGESREGRSDSDARNTEHSAQFFLARQERTVRILARENAITKCEENLVMKRRRQRRGQA
jgi:hypothetical protein